MNAQVHTVRASRRMMIAAALVATMLAVASQASPAAAAPADADAAAR